MVMPVQEKFCQTRDPQKTCLSLPHDSLSAGVAVPRRHVFVTHGSLSTGAAVARRQGDGSEAAAASGRGGRGRRR